MSSYSQTVTFEKVRSFGSKTGKCPVCGKSASRKKEFWATINPFNKNDQGEVKSFKEVYADVRAKRDKWAAELVLHARCEGAQP